MDKTHKASAANSRRPALAQEPSRVAVQVTSEGTPYVSTVIAALGPDEVTRLVREGFAKADNKGK